MIIHVDILDASDLSDSIEGAFKVDFFKIQRAIARLFFFFKNDTLLILVGALEQRLAASTFQPTALQTAFTQGPTVTSLLLLSALGAYARPIARLLLLVERQISP